MLRIAYNLTIANIYFSLCNVYNNTDTLEEGQSNSAYYMFFSESIQKIFILILALTITHSSLAYSKYVHINNLRRAVINIFVFIFSL